MGSIRTRQLASGKPAYLARYRAPDGSERTHQFRTKKEADAWIRANEHALASGTWVDPERGKRTLAEYYADWDRIRLHLKPKSLSRERSLWRTHLEPEFGALPLAQIEREHVKA